MPNPITEQRMNANPRDLAKQQSDAEKPPVNVDSFPPNTFFALFDDRAAAKNAADRLRETGVEENDVEVYAGKAGSKRLDPDDEDAGLFDKIVKLAQELSDFKTFVRDCSATVAAGKVLLLVRFEDEAGRNTMEKIVRETEGAPLAYTDNWALVKFASISSG